MLDVADAERKTTSRLSCQLRLEPELDGIVLIVPQLLIAPGRGASQLAVSGAEAVTCARRASS